MFRNQPATPCLPFFKWQGGKRKLTDVVLDYIGDQDYDTYYEPFAGGAAIFFALQPVKAELSDLNPYVVQAFNDVRDEPELVIAEALKHKEKHATEYYKKICKKLPHYEGALKTAAFLYLNGTCFNGMFRINSAGECNSTINDTRRFAFNPTNVRNCSQALQGAKAFQRTFTDIPIKADCLYYFDPPYHEAYNVSYVGDFTEDDQGNLADLCKMIDRKGGYFVISNSATDLIRKLYKGYKQHEFEVFTSIAGDSAYRGLRSEFIATNISHD